MVLRDTGSTTCVVKSALIKPEQMTGTYELCMLIDGVVKRYPTAVVELKTTYYTGTAKMLCMESPVQDIIIGNIPGALGAEIQQNTGTNDITDLAVEAKPTDNDISTKFNTASSNTTNKSSIKSDTNEQINSDSTTHEQCAAVHTRAMVAKESKPPKPLKVKSVQT